jgi:predicted solute-binding protein
VLDYPSRLADSLSNGSLDVALIPSIEYFRRPGYEVDFGRLRGSSR